MSTALILDTCVLPLKGGVHQNPLLSAMIRIATIRQFDVLIVDISRSESLSKRKRAADEAIERLQSAIAWAGKYFEREQLDYYLPSSDDAMELWREDLDASFATIDTHGEDALEALHREAWRKVPAKATQGESATGSRDSAIWLSVKRRHMAAVDNVTHFVSSNTSDFSDKQNKNRLREELAIELDDSLSNFHYYISISSVVDSLADKSEVEPICVDKLREMLDATDMESGVLEVLRAQSDRIDDIVPISISVNSASELRAYSVDGVRLAQIRIELSSFAVAAEKGAPDPDRPVPGQGVVWVAKIGEELTYEIDHIEFAGVTIKPR